MEPTVAHKITCALRAYASLMENMEKKLEFIDLGKMKFTIRSLIIIIAANVASAAIIMAAVHNRLRIWVIIYEFIYL